MKSALPRPRAAVRQLATAATKKHHRQHVPSSLALFSTSKLLNQVHPRGEYYDILITNPIPYAKVKSENPPTTANPQPPKPEIPATKTPPANKKPAAKASSEEPAKEMTPVERARVVFGSRLAGPVERANRLAELRNQSKLIAGVLVPPKPEEPENCCMSGCVDCVWDRFRDEMEGWASANAEATKRLQAQEGGVAAGVDSNAPKAQQRGGSAPEDAMSMDDDGGGSSSNWGDLPAEPKISKDMWNDDLYKSLPVGIREFMKQEKRLKMKHMENGTLGG